MDDKVETLPPNDTQDDVLWLKNELEQIQNSHEQRAFVSLTDYPGKRDNLRKLVGDSLRGENMYSTTQVLTFIQDLLPDGELKATMATALQDPGKLPKDYFQVFADMTHVEGASELACYNPDKPLDPLNWRLVSSKIMDRQEPLLSKVVRPVYLFVKK